MDIRDPLGDCEMWQSDRCTAISVCHAVMSQEPDGRLWTSVAWLKGQHDSISEMCLCLECNLIVCRIHVNTFSQGFLFAGRSLTGRELKTLSRLFKLLQHFSLRQICPSHDLSG